MSAPQPGAVRSGRNQPDRWEVVFPGVALLEGMMGSQSVPPHTPTFMGSLATGPDQQGQPVTDKTFPEWELK